MWKCFPPFFKSAILLVSGLLFYFNLVHLYSGSMTGRARRSTLPLFMRHRAFSPVQFFDRVPLALPFCPFFLVSLFAKNTEPANAPVPFLAHRFRQRFVFLPGVGIGLSGFSLSPLPSVSFLPDLSYLVYGPTLSLAVPWLFLPD